MVPRVYPKTEKDLIQMKVESVFRFASTADEDACSMTPAILLRTSLTNTIHDRSNLAIFSGLVSITVRKLR